jgi:peptide deformylase
MYKLVPENDPILKEIMPNYDFGAADADPIALAKQLFEVIEDTRALGVSANQIGIRARVFILYGDPCTVCFNPRIVDISSDEIILEEGCLSFPGLFIKMKRPQGIRVRYENELGETFTKKMVGMTARVFQHELDHLNGVVFTEQANPIHLKNAKRKRKIYSRKIKRIANVSA